MTTSEQLNEICPALAAARKEIQVIHHNSQMVVGKANGRNVYKGYATLDQLIEGVVEPLTKNGLFFSFSTEVGGKDNIWVGCTIFHQSGQWIKAIVPSPVANNDKDHWGNLTSGRRYVLMLALGLAVAGEDDAAARPTTLGNQPANNNGQSSNGNGQPNRHDMAIEDRLRDMTEAFSKLMGKTVTDQEIQEMAGVSLRDITHEHIDKLQDVYRELRAAAQQAAETVGA